MMNPLSMMRGCAAELMLLLILTSASSLAQSSSVTFADCAASQSSVASPQSKPHPMGSSPPVHPESEVGTWDLSVWANEAVGNSAYGDVGDAYVSMAGFRTGYVFARPDLHGRPRGALEYFFDVIPVFILTKPKVIYGGGISPVGFRWNFLGSRRQPFVETSLGGILSTRDVPPGDTSKLNFTVTARGGLALISHQRNAITASVGFWHLSNAHMGNTNPSLNAFTFGIEYHWFKSR
jgi:hypothetical protein